MDSELEDLHSAIVGSGVKAHWHKSGGDGSCADGELCIREGEGFTAVVASADRSKKVFVDPMTAWGVIDGLDADAGDDAVWSELESIDHGQ
jgi:hypothetical protein